MCPDGSGLLILERPPVNRDFTTVSKTGPQGPECFPDDPEAYFGAPPLDLPPSPKTTLEERVAARIARVTGHHKTI